MATINDWTPSATHRLTLGSFEAFCNPENFPEISAELVQKAGGGVPAVSLLDDAHRQEAEAEAETEPAPPTKRETPLPPKQNSTWEDQVKDDAAKIRIEAQQKALIKGGVKVNASEQFFETGTRMADVGYSAQRDREAEFLAQKPIAECRAELTETVIGEKREDVEISAYDLAKTISVNGKVTCLDGRSLTEQAIRGLSVRLDSPMLGYLLGLRSRVISQRGTEGAKCDRDMVAEVLRHELKRNGETKLKLRARKNPADVFAIVSPAYTSADAPEVLGQLLDALPDDARGTWSYDPTTTTWELRAEVWTPTAVDEQAVGEPFKGYASFRSRDNGTGRFGGGGGVLLIRCLNASVYEANAEKASRVHRGKVKEDVAIMVEQAVKAISVLTKAWGSARTEAIPTEGVKLQDLIPDFYRALLTERKGVLVGVLPGRTETHVKALTEAFRDERREPSHLVRSDFAQGWTRYAQDFAQPVQREAERAIGEWLVSGEMPVPVGA